MSLAPYVEYLPTVFQELDDDTPCQARTVLECTRVALFRVYYTECECGNIVLDLCLLHTDKNKEGEAVEGSLTCPVCACDILMIKIIPLRKA